MQINGGKRSRYHPDLPSAQKGLKIPKAGVINWQPKYPDGEDEKSLLQHKEDIISELKQRSPDEGLIARRMNVKFARCRKDINDKMSINIMKNWPALLEMKAVRSTYFISTSKNMEFLAFSKGNYYYDEIFCKVY